MGESLGWKKFKIDVTIRYKFNESPSEEVSLFLLPYFLRNWSSHQLETIFKY